jgi:hypothetical protein
LTGVEQPSKVALDGDVGHNVARALDDGVDLPTAGVHGRERVGHPPAPAVVVPAVPAAADQQQVLDSVTGQQPAQARQQQPRGQIAARTQDQQCLLGRIAHRHLSKRVDGAPWSRYGGVVGLPAVAELSVVLGVVDVGAPVRVVVGRAAEVVGAPVAVGSGAEVADVVAGTGSVGCEGSACREPSELLVVPTGGGLTSR